MTLLHAPQFSSWIRGHLLCRVEEVPDALALTFDDGPSRTYTPRVLDVLARHGAHATFFTLAGNASRCPETIRRMIAEGHDVGLHGDVHWPLPLLTPGLIRRELERGAAAVARATPVRSRFYRPPFGFMMPMQARYVAELGYISVLGDVYPEDTQRPGTAKIVERTLPRLSPGSIVILHDGSPLGEPDRSQTVEALEQILEYMKSRGLRGVSVSELLAAAPEEAHLVEASLSRAGIP
jgi:peptidoglycan/xylan/chitin deacetylase (PgdA/CDA1 family)